MKTKRILSVILAVMIAATCVLSVSAAQLTEESPSGRTEVTARILGNPGDVSYIITIPDVVDFGVLTQPETDANPVYKDVTYTVEATKIEGLDPDTQQVSVYVKDEHASVNGNDEYGQEFWISNKANSDLKFSYDLYDVAPITDGSINLDFYTMSIAAGYYLEGFTEQGQSVTGTLRIDQTQLCAYDLSELLGEYSGYMVFFSAIEDI